MDVGLVLLYLGNTGVGDVLWEENGLENDESFISYFG